MLNRRKQLYDLDGQSGDEQRALLGTEQLGTHELTQFYDIQPQPNVVIDSIASSSSTPINHLHQQHVVGSTIAIPSNYKHSHVQDFVYYKVQPGDTLQNLSVRYSCPVASIKRLNNLWSDQEIFGLSRLKLPVGKLRLLATTYPIEESSSTPQIQYVENPNANEQHQDETMLHDSLFKSMDVNIEKARTAAKLYDANAIMQTLAQNGNVTDNNEDTSEVSKIATREAEALLNDLSDFGLSYNFLLLFIFIVCLVCPLAYVIYLEETHHDTNKTP